MGLVSSSRPENPSARAEEEPPVQVEPLPETDLKRVTLGTRAAERLGIETAPVREEIVSGRRRTTVPYAALLYDASGATWVYTNPESLVFVRHRVSVEDIAGDLAMLSDGPAVGTAVVTAGAAELFGAEFGVGK